MAHRHFRVLGQHRADEPDAEGVYPRPYPRVVHLFTVAFPPRADVRAQH